MAVIRGPAEDLALIARVRRAMPRNADVMRVCDIAEAAVTKTVTKSLPRHEKRNIVTRRGRPPLGDQAMSPAERQRRHRRRKAEARRRR
jgi:hypothetical protein